MIKYPNEQELAKYSANIMNNDIPFVLNELGVSHKDYFDTVEPSKIKYLIYFVHSGKINKSDIKNILINFFSKFSFIESLEPFYIDTDAAGDQIDTILDEVISQNPEMVEKAKKDPKLVNWFIGQVMKGATVKLDATIVKTKVNERFK